MDVLDAARRWLADDPDPVTREELAAVLSAAEAGDGPATVDLTDRFAARLEFGTAGLRGAMGAGPNRMNRVVVRRTAAGLAVWLRCTGGEQAVQRGVVVGFDARHHSLEFARDTASVLAGAGVTVHLMPGPLPTPILAFSLRQLGCAAGVMVTASHNPAADNGYKVYDASGSQIVGPADREISDAIDAVGSVRELPLATLDDERVRRLGPEVVERYLSAVVGLVDAAAAAGRTPPLVSVYTPMHGVGGAVALRAFARAGLPAPHVVTEQADPDPDFPTLSFPNPEEPGALDRALDLARTVGADVVLANDPDADRLGVAVPDPAVAGGWRLLSGDEIGVLLASRVIDRIPPSQRGATAVATTIVSSTMLSELAAAEGVGYVETLTGFKWIARATDGDDRRLAFGYEEALGSCVAPSLVRDKDGISAMLVFADLVASLKVDGRTVPDALDDLARRFGVHATSQWSLRLAGLDGVAQREAVMARLRGDPPAELAGRPVVRFADLLAPGGPLPPSDVVVLHLDGARVVIRPSGTEPKLKSYFEVVVPVVDDLAGARELADAELLVLRQAVADLVGTPGGPTG